MADRGAEALRSRQALLVAGGLVTTASLICIMLFRAVERFVDFPKVAELPPRLERVP
jgi:hypothetical protein